MAFFASSRLPHLGRTSKEVYVEPRMITLVQNIEDDTFQLEARYGVYYDAQSIIPITSAELRGQFTPKQVRSSSLVSLLEQVATQQTGGDIQFIELASKRSLPPRIRPEDRDILRRNREQRAAVTAEEAPAGSSIGGGAEAPEPMRQ